MSDQASDRLERRDIAALGIITLIVLAGNALLLFTDQTWQNLSAFGYDFEVNSMAAYGIARQSYWIGHFPVWSSMWAGGLPMIAFYISSMFHPAIVLQLLVSPPWVVVVHTMVHLELIAVFSFLLFRGMGIGQAAAMAAAVWNALSGYGVWVSPVMGVLNAAPWFIFWMWSVHAFIKRPRLVPWFGHVVGIWLLFTSGDIQELIYAAYLGGLWAVIMVALKPGPKLRVLAPLALGAVLALLIVQVQFLPTVNFFSRGLKMAPFTWAAYRDSFPAIPQEALSVAGLFSKRFEGIFWCIAPAVFSLGAFRLKNKAPALRAAMIVSAALLVVFGLGRLGLGRVLYMLPLLGHAFRHYKVLMVLEPMLMIVAAFGADRYLTAPLKPGRDWMIGLISLAAVPASLSLPAMLILAAIAVAALVLRPPARWRGALVVALAGAECFSVLWHPSREFPRWRFWDQYVEAGQAAGLPYRVGVMFPALAIWDHDYLTQLPIQPGGIGGEKSFDFYFTYPLKGYSEILAAIQPDSLSVNQQGLETVDFSTPFKSEDFIAPENRHLVNLLGLRYIFAKDFALHEADRYPILSDPEYLLNPANRAGFRPYQRVMVPGPDGERPALSTSQAAAFRYRARLHPGDRLRFGAAVTGPGQAAATFLIKADEGGERIWFQETLPADAGEVSRELPLAPFLNGAGETERELEFVVTFAPDGVKTGASWIDPTLIRPDNTIQWRAGGRLMMLENTEFIPLFRLVHRTLAAHDDDQALRIMKDAKRYDPRREAVMVGPGPALLGPETGPGEGKDEIETLSSFHDESRLTVTTRSPALLAWTENYYPGWRAWVDGSEARIFKADLCFKAVALSPGRHDVYFRFMPADFRVGLFASLSSLVFAAFCGTLLRRRAAPADPGADHGHGI
jgi:hypothetical protein